MAGFFDGDGNVDERVGEYVISVVLGFTDNWPEQLRAVKRFLDGEGIEAGNLTHRKWKGKTSAWQLRICSVGDVLRAATKMFPHCAKKRAELQGVVGYLEDRLTGDEFIRVVNHQVAIGNKVGKIRGSKLPMTRREANVMRRRVSLRLAHAATDAVVPDEFAREIIRLYRAGDYSMRALADTYGYSRSAVERILGKKYRKVKRLSSFRLED